MKLILAIGLFVSFHVSATVVCFDNQLDYPVAADLTTVNRINQTAIRSYELMPVMYICTKFSNLTYKKITYAVHGVGENCSGQIKGQGKVTIFITPEGCVLNSQEK